MTASSEPKAETQQRVKAPKGKKSKQAKGTPPSETSLEAALDGQYELLLEGEEPGTAGELVASIEDPAEPPSLVEPAEPPSLVEPGLAGKTVAICGPGVSIKDLFSEAAREGGSRALADETWCLDSLGALLNNDRTFHMSPVTKLGEGESGWISTCKIVYSSGRDDRFPNVIAYPIEKVMEFLNVAYFNSSAAYAIAFAIAERVGRIKVYGLDPPTAKERANIEFLLCKAIHYNTAVEISGSSTLLDNDVPHDKKVYGFCELEDPYVLTMLNGKMLLRRRSEVSLRK